MTKDELIAYLLTLDPKVVRFLYDTVTKMKEVPSLGGREGRETEAD